MVNLPFENFVIFPLPISNKKLRNVPRKIRPAYYREAHMGLTTFSLIKKKTPLKDCLFSFVEPHRLLLYYHPQLFTLPSCCCFTQVVLENGVLSIWN